MLGESRPITAERQSEDSATVIEMAQQQADEMAQQQADLQ